MAFHKATNSLAKQLDPEGNLIPIKSIIDQNHFSLSCLVEKKKKTQWWQTPTFHKTDYRLCDLLLNGDQSINTDVEHTSPVTITDVVDGNLEGGIAGTTVTTEVEIKGTASISHERSVKLKKAHIQPQFFDSMTKRKINLEHDFIKQSNKHQRNLYMITEVVVATEETKFEEQNKAEGGIFYKAYMKLSLKGSGASKKGVTIPKDCILAFRVKKLLIEDGFLRFSHYSIDKTGTFDGTEIELNKEMQTDQVIRLCAGGYSKKTTHLLKEAVLPCTSLTYLSAELYGAFLCSFLAIMKENDLLQKLMLQLEQALEDVRQVKLTTDKPELQRMVDNLYDSKGVIVTELAEPVFYFLQALNDLTELQLEILVKSVDKRIVSKQLVVIEQILLNDFTEEDRDFIVHCQQLTEEDLIATGAMIEMSGVILQRKESNLAGTGKPSALSAIGALYVALYVLNLLCSPL